MSGGQRLRACGASRSGRSRARRGRRCSFVDVFKIYRSGPVETVALRGLDLRVERERARRRARALRLWQEHDAGARRGARRALGRRGPRRRAVAQPARRGSSSPRYRARESRSSSRATTSGRRCPRARTSPSRCDSPAVRASRHGRRRGARARSDSPSVARHRAGALSGGEQQRVAIAAAVRAPSARSCSPTSRPASSTLATSSVVLDALAQLTATVRQHRRRRHPLRTGRGGRRPGARDARRAGVGVTAVASAAGAGGLPRRHRRPRPRRARS